MDKRFGKVILGSALLAAPLLAAASLCGLADWGRTGEVLVARNDCGGRSYVGFSCGGWLGNQVTFTYIRLEGPQRCLLA